MSGAPELEVFVKVRPRLLSIVRKLERLSDPEAGLASQAAVFLHCGWRCGSTYIWSRFRESPETLCFYEPFNEVLARCSAKRISRETTQAWNSRHPPLSRPYREEFLPLLRIGGLRGLPGYREEFAVARYFPTDGVAPELRYLSRLLEHARKIGKRPVLGFSRSLGRASAIKEAFGGYHIVIRRDPRQQWLSCRSYRIKEGAVYFEVCHFLILALAACHSRAGQLARQLGLPSPPAGSFREQFEFMKAALWPWSDEFSYRAFVAVSQLSNAAVGTSADLTIDVDRLGRDTEHRDEVRADIFARTGLDVGFDDCNMGLHDIADVSVDFQAIEQDVARLLRARNVQPQVEDDLLPVFGEP